MMWRRSKRSASTRRPGGEQHRPQLGEGHQPDEGAGVRQLVGQRNQRVTFCIQVPMLDAKAPAATRRNAWWLSAAPTVPVAPPTAVTGASTSASQA